MSVITTSVNPSIKIGTNYDTSKYMLGSIINSSFVELIPRLTTLQIAALGNSTVLQTGYKVWDVTQELLFSWTGSDWSELNSAVAANLVANTVTGQTIIDISSTIPPQAGQVLTAVSPTKAIWAAGGGGGGTLNYNASYIGIIGDGVSSTITVNHNLGTENIICGVWETSGSMKAVSCNISIISINAVSLEFTTIPTVGQYKVTILSTVFNNPTSGLGLPNQANKAGDFLSTDGNTAFWTPVPTLPDQSGYAGKFLATNGENPSWISPLPSQLLMGGKYLYTDGTTATWQNTPVWMSNPMQYMGDIIIGGTDGAAGRLGIGSVGQLLTVTSNTTIGWTTRTLLPTISSGTTGLFLTNDGSNPSWSTINPALGISSSTTNQILSNNGSTYTWITNLNPPSVTNQAGNFLTNNGTTMSWTSISQVPTINSSKSGYFLSNDGTSASWQPGLSNPMTSIGDLIIGGTSGNPTRLGIGTLGQILAVGNSNTLHWITNNALSNPMTSLGDIIIGNASGTPNRLAVGSPGQVLTVYDTGSGYYSVEWAAASLVNPMTSIGDLIIGGTSGTPTKLGIGASGTVLTSNGSTASWTTVIPPINTGTNSKFLTNNGSTSSWGTIPNQLPAISGDTNGYYLTNDGSSASWSIIPAGFTNPMTTAGDMIAANSGGTAGRLSIGTSGQVLTVVSGGPSWQTPNYPTGLPTQTGNNGTFLTTNGTTASWTYIYQVPSVTGNSGYFLGNNGSTYSWMELPNQLPTVTGQAGKFLTTNGVTSSWIPLVTIPSISESTSGQVLANNGVNTYWETASSSASLGVIPLSYTSSTLAIGGSEIDAISTTCYSFQLQNISASAPCRIRFYGTNVQAVADNSRPSTVDPSGNIGLFAEFVFISTALSWVVSPTVIMFNGDITQTTNIYMNIQNTSNSSTTITINMNLLKMQ